MILGSGKKSFILLTLVSFEVEFLLYSNTDAFFFVLVRWGDAESTLYLKCVWQVPDKCSVGDC